MRKLMLFMAMLCMSIGLATAQVSQVTGTVTSRESNEPVAGARVHVKGTQVVTHTDDNGRFVLKNVPRTAKTLVISLLGYKTAEVNVAGVVNVSLETAHTELSEAVVLGYGTAKKLGTVVGTVTKVGSDKIENKPIVNAMDAMQGKVAGVQILNNSGDAGDIGTISTTVRGVGSLNASNEPLFVIDGAPVDASVFAIMNHNDIESITVLRDASATSIYGSRAANGVFFVTTKKGSRNEKAVIKVGQTMGWSALARKIGNPMNSKELLDYQLKNGIISGAQYAEYKKSGVNTNWQDYFYDDNAPFYNTTFSISGGSEKTSYYTSASYLKKDGLTPLSKYKRITFRTNIDSRPNDWFHYGVNLGMSFDERKDDYINNTTDLYINSGVLGGLLAAPYYNPYDENGDPLETIPFLGGYNYQVRKKYNPYMTNDANINGVAFIELTPLKGLTIKSQLGLDGYDTRSNTELLPSYPGNTAGNQGRVSKTFARSSTWTITNTIEYALNINDNNQLTLLAGQEGIKGSSESFNSRTTGQSDDRLMELQHGSEVAISDFTSSHAKYEYLSFFGRADYAFMNKYFANITVRNDKSSRFGKNNRSATFISGGLMWNAKSEDFLKEVYTIDDLKVKFSVGTTGNSSGIGNYASLGTVGTTRYNGNANGWVLASPGNADLGWEKQIQWNFGFNARLFNRLNVELNYYNRKTQDMLMEVPVPYTTGFSSQMLNIGELTNRGIEFTFDVDAIKNWNGLNVNVYGNISYNKNKITKLFYGLDKYIMQDYGLAYYVGESVNYYLPVRAGIDPADGLPYWYVPDADGNLTDQTTKEWDETALSANSGKPMDAPWTGGFGLVATWKGFTLSADFSFVLGKYMQDNIQYFTKNSAQAASGYNQDRSMKNAWEKPGDITSVPKFGTSNYFDSSLLQNASFCRLKNLSLTYDLPRKWMKATGFISNVRLMAAARNLLTFTKWKGSDPEFNTNVAKAVYPNTREYSLGVEVSF